MDDPYLVRDVATIILDLAITHGRVTADDLRRAAPGVPHKRSVYGAAFRLLQNDGRLLHQGYEPSRVPQNHGRRIKVYSPRQTVHQGGNCQ